MLGNHYFHPWKKLVVWTSGLVVFPLQERKFHALEKEMVQADDEWLDRLAFIWARESIWVFFFVSHILMQIEDILMHVFFCFVFLGNSQLIQLVEMGIFCTLKNSCLLFSFAVAVGWAVSRFKSLRAWRKQAVGNVWNLRKWQADQPLVGWGFLWDDISYQKNVGIFFISHEISGFRNLKQPGWLMESKAVFFSWLTCFFV